MHTEIDPLFVTKHHKNQCHLTNPEIHPQTKPEPLIHPLIHHLQLAQSLNPLIKQTPPYLIKPPRHLNPLQNPELIRQNDQGQTPQQRSQPTIDEIVIT